MEFPVYTRIGPELVSGCGVTVRDGHGREYIDFYGGHAVASLGYSHAGLSQAISAQAKDLVFQSNAIEVPVRTRAVERLAGQLPSGVDHVLLVNSGAEANENALRLALTHTQRLRVTALRGAFHGRTAAAAAITDGSTSWYGFPNRPFEVDWLEPEDLDGLESAVTDQTAAFIFEPVQGVAGARALSTEFVQAARRRCTETGALMIADEVQTGAGRCGTFFAIEALGVIPDILTAAKGLAGGFPIGATCAGSELCKDLPKGSYGTTFGGGPMACAAMDITIKAVSRPAFLANVNRISQRLMTETRGGVVRSVSGRGLLIGLHTIRPSRDVRAELLDAGFITGDAKDPNVVRLLPPLVIDDAAVDTFLAALRKVPA